MNLNNIDEFLLLKSQRTIDAYFAFLSKGFELIDPIAKEIPIDKEHLLKEYFRFENVEYQVAATTFVSEVFHIIETYLKSNLLRAGDYLVYPSMDKYPEQKAKLLKYNLDENENLKKILIDFTKSSKRNKTSRLAEVSKTLAKELFSDGKEILVNSISCSEALYRLEKYLNWKISLEAKERFELFIQNRNEIVHFNTTTNITFSVSHALFVLINFSKESGVLYPKFAGIPQYLEKDIQLFNILTQEILFNIDTVKAFEKLKDNATIIVNELTS